MIRVNVLVFPNGDAVRARRIGQLEIANVTPGLPEQSRYVAELSGDRKLRAVVDHRRSDGWEVLLRKVLEEMTR